MASPSPCLQVSEIGGRGPLACGSGKRFDYFGGIVAEKPVGQINVIRPIAGLIAGREPPGAQADRQH